MEVRRVERLSRRMIRVTFGGTELERLPEPDPAASVRLLLPPAGRASGELVIPTWHGNDFRLPDGQKATIRTFTPRRLDREHNELDLDIVDHGAGVAPAWARTAQPGNPAAVSGPARGYAIDEEAEVFVLAGDETAIPAIGQLLEHLPWAAAVHAFIEVPDPEAELVLPPRDGATVEWLHRSSGAAPGEALVTAVGAAELTPATRVWAAGEAAAMQRIRRHVFDARALPRSHAVVRGYWKHGRAGDADEA
jgi:NADPH-dependent ferric siderophore reductase